MDITLMNEQEEEFNFQRKEPFVWDDTEFKRKGWLKVEKETVKCSPTSNEDKICCVETCANLDMSVQDMVQQIREAREARHCYWNRQHYHPMQDAVLFQSQGHMYYIYGSSRHVISLTKFIACFFHDFDALEESERMANSKTFKGKKHQPSYAYHGCECAADIRSKWEEAAFLGTEFHRNVEWFLNGIPWEEQEIHPKNKVCVEQFKKVFEDKEFWEWDMFWTEQPLCYPPALLAGSPDIILKSKTDPMELIIIDLKTCENLDYQQSYGTVKYGYGPCSHIADTKINKYGLQQSGIKWMLEQYGYRVRHMFLLNTHRRHKKARIFGVQDFTLEFGEMIAYRQQLLDARGIPRYKDMMMTTTTTTTTTLPNQDTDLTDSVQEPIQETVQDTDMIQKPVEDSDMIQETVTIQVPLQEPVMILDDSDQIPVFEESRTDVPVFEESITDMDEEAEEAEEAKGAKGSQKNSNMRQDSLISMPSHSIPECINSAELNETVLIL